MNCKFYRDYHKPNWVCVIPIVEIVQPSDRFFFLPNLDPIKNLIEGEVLVILNLEIILAS